MKAIIGLIGLFAGMVCAASAQAPLPSDHVPGKYKPAIDKALEWLAKQQNADGSFRTAKDELPAAMTAFAGLALLMEGSTTGDGKYADHLRKASAWFIKNAQKGGANDGLLVDPKHKSETRYMYGHGFAMLFLASVYAEENDGERRRQLREVLTRAVKFSVDAQSSKGGWFYIAGQDAADSDEASVTSSQVQGLLAARMAGIAVPRPTLQRAVRSLEENAIIDGAPPPRGGIRNDRSSLTAGAVACAFGAGDCKSDQVKKWLKFCQRSIPSRFVPRLGFDPYTHFYYAQVLYALGDTGYEKLFPGAEEPLQWRKYRETFFDHLGETQKEDGRWDTGGFGIGPVYATAVHLIILQLDNEPVPFLGSRIADDPARGEN